MLFSLANYYKLLAADMKPYARKASETGCQLGSGTYGSVIELKSAGEVVAGKVFKSISSAQTQTVLKKIQKEMMLLLQIHHPNIVESKGV